MSVDGGAWQLSKSVSELIEPMLPMAVDVASREAVRVLHSNHINLTRFACRAVGTRGSPRVSAPLAGKKRIHSYY